MPTADFEKLIVEAVARFKAMPFEDQRKMRAAQRESWVVGEMMLEHPEMTREEALRLYEQVR
jgi:hypothetical protein